MHGGVGQYTKVGGRWCDIFFVSLFLLLLRQTMSEDLHKTSSSTMADEKGLSHAHTASDNGVGEIHDLTQLGYKPELTRNRSMLTLLFQCLAIAAIRKFIPCCDVVIRTLICVPQRMERVVHS